MTTQRRDQLPLGTRPAVTSPEFRRCSARSRAWPCSHQGGRLRHHARMDLGFRGEVADFYHAYRRGYPAAVIDVLADTFGLDTHDAVIDLGCGTGQLTLPVARRVRAAVGVDPEPDMLLRARRAARDQGVANVSWIVGADSDMRSLGALLGPRSVGAVTIGQALHWMNQDDLFPVLRPLAREGGGVAVVTNGTPLWLQDSAWSRALRRS